MLQFEGSVVICFIEEGSIVIFRVIDFESDESIVILEVGGRGIIALDLFGFQGIIIVVVEGGKCIECFHLKFR